MYRAYVQSIIKRLRVQCGNWGLLKCRLSVGQDGADLPRRPSRAYSQSTFQQTITNYHFVNVAY
jgi:hypothetical protein